MSREIREMATKRLYRAKNGEILGVCKGIAEWRDLPVGTVRLIFIIVAIATAIAPCLVIYFLVGLILPMNPYDGTEKANTYYYKPEPEDFVNERKAESQEEYERRKKESDWDNRFSNS